MPAAADSVVDDAALVMSELATNAVRAGCSSMSVAIDVHRQHLRLGVQDDAPGWPRRLPGGPADPNGRGLAIIDALSERWGAEQSEAGKEVWAELPFPDGVAAELACQL